MHVIQAVPAYPKIIIIVFLSIAIYEEASNYQPLQRNPLEYLNDENNYQSLTA
jgi:hypothetical protein